MSRIRSDFLLERFFQVLSIYFLSRIPRKVSALTSRLSQLLFSAPRREIREFFHSITVDFVGLRLTAFSCNRYIEELFSFTDFNFGRLFSSTTVVAPQAIGMFKYVERKRCTVLGIYSVCFHRIVVSSHISSHIDFET